MYLHPTCTSVLNNGRIAGNEIPNHDIISCLAVVKIGLKLKRHNFLLCGWIFELPLLVLIMNCSGINMYLFARGLEDFLISNWGPALARTADNRQNSCKFSISIQTFLPVNGWENIPACHVYKRELLNILIRYDGALHCAADVFILRFN